MGKEVENAEEKKTLPKAFPNRPARIAHRGDIWSGPENTMSAFTGAVNKGCEGIETDIRRTAAVSYTHLQQTNIHKRGTGTDQRCDSERG